MITKKNKMKKSLHPDQSRLIKNGTLIHLKSELKNVEFYRKKLINEIKKKTK